MKKYLEKYLINKLLPDPLEIGEEIRKHLSELPAPVVWLLGKAQSGKSSIVHGITGVSKIEIGEGYRPCTKSSQLYSFPDEDAPFLRFLDTRGLEEARYDPAEDLSYCQKRSNLLLVVVRIDDHAVSHLIDALREIRRASPKIPIILALTCLHESYSEGEEHTLPYPYPSSGGSQRVIDHLEHQKKRFQEFTDSVVALDFTKEEDGYTPQFYGLPELLSALDSALPEVAWNSLMEESRHELSRRYLSAANPTIIAYSLIAGSAAVIPLPLLDLPLVTGIQLKMLHAIARLHGQEVDKVLLGEVMGALGISFLARAGGREALKVLPGGSLLSSVYTASVTYGLGQMFSAYLSLIKEGYRPSRKELREMYDHYVADGTTLFERYKQKGASSSVSR